MLLHLERIFITAMAILLAQIPAANAEWKLERLIGGWEVERDADALFGTVGSRMTTRATNASGDYKLVLRCENSVFDIFVLLNEQIFSRPPRANFIDVIYKFGSRQNLTSGWIFRPEAGDRIFFNDPRDHKRADHEYMSLIQEQIYNRDISQSAFLDLLAQDNTWFTWRLSTFDTFAVLINADKQYRLAFDTTGTAEATKLMFTLCGHPNAPAVWLQEYSSGQSTTAPSQPATSPTDPYDGQRLNLTSWTPTSVQGRTAINLTLRSGQCLEIQVLQKQQGNSISIWQWRGSQVTQIGTISGNGGLVGNLDGQIGLSSANGSPIRVQMRTWTNAGSQCQ